MKLRTWIPALAILTVIPSPTAAQTIGGVELIELTIAQAHEAMLAGTLTSRQLVDAYLARIEAYDKRGPSFNAIIMTNPNAQARADELTHRSPAPGSSPGLFTASPS